MDLMFHCHSVHLRIFVLTFISCCIPWKFSGEIKRKMVYVMLCDGEVSTKNTIKQEGISVEEVEDQPPAFPIEQV